MSSSDGTRRYPIATRLNRPHRFVMVMREAARGASTDAEGRLKFREGEDIVDAISGKPAPFTPLPASDDWRLQRMNDLVPAWLEPKNGSLDSVHTSPACGQPPDQGRLSSRTQLPQANQPFDLVLCHS
jgi:hypothetical protein